LERCLIGLKTGSRIEKKELFFWGAVLNRLRLKVDFPRISA